MPNTLLTIGGITRRALMVLENNLVAAKFVNREYQDQFAMSGAKIGATLQSEAAIELSLPKPAGS